MKHFSEVQLRSAVEQAGLPPDTFDRIRKVLEAGHDTNVVPRFEAAHVSYYLGALLIIGAMGWFVTSAWNRLSGFVILAIALSYAVLFAAVGARLFRRAATRIPGGLLVTVAVCMTPLAVYGLERGFGWWPALDPGPYTHFHPLIRAGWVVMECATVCAAVAALKWIRFPFITAPAAYALWYLSMDATAYLFGAHWNFHQECWISVWFGLAMMIAAYAVDGRFEQDFSFWFYLFGLLTFTGGLTLLQSGGQMSRAVYCLIHLALIALAVVIQRKAFLVFGTIGVFAYLVTEAEGYFRNSFGFTLALTAIGIVFIAAGVVYKRNEAVLEARMSPFIPERIRRRHLV